MLNQLRLHLGGARARGEARFAFSRRTAMNAEVKLLGDAADVDRRIHGCRAESSPLLG